MCIKKAPGDAHTSPRGKGTVLPQEQTDYTGYFAYMQVVFAEGGPFHE
ncbi:MAG: hypothetical protein HFF04_00920 [Oscillospiraceae bacterium]|nr:hypothetical protein [Oscillospiraceae bacterium]